MDYDIFETFLAQLDACFENNRKENSSHVDYCNKDCSQQIDNLKKQYSEFLQDLYNLSKRASEFAGKIVHLQEELSKKLVSHHERSSESFDNNFKQISIKVREYKKIFQGL